MFTGIIKHVGRIARKSVRGQLTKFRIDISGWKERFEIGDSVAVNGTCLTIVEKTRSLLLFEAVPETLKSTGLGALREGDAVNLESSLRAGDSFGGHFVSGHVDSVGKISKILPMGDSRVIEIRASRDTVRYVIEKGSIAVDGISLTVQKVRGTVFEIAIIPHTLKHTNLSKKKEGDFVNLEVDFMAKYMEKYFLERFGQDRGAGLSEKFLRERGF